MSVKVHSYQLSSTVMGGVMIWVYFRARGPGHLVVNESVMNSSVYQSFLESEVMRSVTAKACLKLGY